MPGTTGTSPVSYRDLATDLGRARPVLERIMRDNIVPFWTRKALDKQGEGYALNYDDRGRYTGPSEKWAIAHARTFWFFSCLTGSPFGEAVHIQLADDGFAFVKQHLWDATYGGVYWSLDPSGSRPAKDGKHVCAQVFTLFALCEYCESTGRDDARALAMELFELIDGKAHDDRYGGYHECFERDWTRVNEDRKGYLGPPAGLKTINTHIHILEAFSSLHRLVGGTRVRSRIGELSDLLVHHAFAGPDFLTIDMQTPDWRPVGGPEGVSYGHAVENVWLLLAAGEEIGSDAGAVLDLGGAVFDRVLNRAFDRRRGGLYGWSPSGARRKVWWEQAEFLLAAAWMYGASGQRRYRDAFLRTLVWIHNRQADWRHGGWHWYPLRFGRKAREKAGQWKTPYHSGRAIVESMRIMEGLGWK